MKFWVQKGQSQLGLFIWEPGLQCEKSFLAWRIFRPPDCLNMESRRKLEFSGMRKRGTISGQMDKVEVTRKKIIFSCIFSYKMGQRQNTPNLGCS